MRERVVAFIFLCALACCAVAFARPRHAPHRVAHYEYVAAVGKLYVYNIDKRPSLVGRLALPGVDEIRGIGASAATGMLYVSYGGFPNGTGHLLEFSLYRRKIVYARGYPFGIDSFDISRDGRLIFMPTGENTSGDTWHVLAANTGRVVPTAAGIASRRLSMRSCDRGPGIGVTSRRCWGTLLGSMAAYARGRN